MAGYTQLLEALWQLAPEGDSAARQGSYPVTLSLTHQGRAAFVQGVNAVYAQLADPDLPDDVRDVYAKLPGTMARLALILHACHVITGKANEAVDVPSVHGAVQLVRYFSGACPTGLCASAEHQGRSAGRDGAPVAPSPWRGVYGTRHTPLG